MKSDLVRRGGGASSKEGPHNVGIRTPASTANRRRDRA